MNTDQEIPSAASAVSVLAKAPKIGSVKTRMRPHLSDHQACALHRWCIHELNDHLLPEVVRAHPKTHTLFFVTAPDVLWERLALSASPRLQSGDHLGARMYHALVESFAWLDQPQANPNQQRSETRLSETSLHKVRSAPHLSDAVLLLGTDSPHLDPQYIATGLKVLRSQTEPLVTIGPADDGGYYTIGCNRAALPSISELFSSDISWGSDTVRLETLKRARRIGLDVVELPMSFDLDRPDDLRRLESIGGASWARLNAALMLHPLTPPQREPERAEYTQALRRLFGLTRFGERLDLSAPRAINEALGRPLDAYHNILVGGTNGKGSTCAALVQLAKERHVRAGCFTSPHLVSFRERIRIGDELITPNEVVSGVEAVFNAAQDAGITLSFFEATWALAAWFFAQRQAEWVIWEVGLGGRLDATNVCEPRVSAIVSISLDHTHVLGDTLEAIAAEKAPIFRDHSAALTAAQDLALEALRPVSPPQLTSLEEALNFPVINHIMSDADQHEPSLSEPLHTHAQIDSSPMLSTPHGRRNLALAWAIADAAGWAPPPWSDHTKLQPWWTRVMWPGRLEYLEGIWLDCAHNPASSKEVARWLTQRSPSRGHAPRHLIVGMSEDKQHDEVLKTLTACCERITFVSPRYPRCLSASMLSAIYQEQVAPLHTHNQPQVQVIPSLTEALRSRDLNALHLVTGSCFLVGEARAWLLGVPFPEVGISTTAR